MENVKNDSHVYSSASIKATDSVSFPRVLQLFLLVASIGLYAKSPPFSCDEVFLSVPLLLDFWRYDTNRHIKLL
jgi:hypothetical protein